MRTLRPLAALLAMAVGAAPLEAQILPITIPKGTIRWDFSGRFDVYEYRWHDGQREEDAADFARPAMDGTFIPDVATAVSQIRKITGDQSLSMSLGSTISSRLVRLGTTGFGGALGLTKWLTIYGNVPLVQVKVEPRLLVNSANATAGINSSSPLFGGSGAVSAFLNQLSAAISTLQAKIASPTDYTPEQKALAQATLAQAEALQTDLTALLSLAFLPTPGSPAGVALNQKIGQLQTVLTQLSVTNFTSQIPLASTAVTDTTLDAYVTSPTGPINANSITDTPTYSYVGDIEVGAAVSIIDRFPKSKVGPGFRLTGQTTVRLRTAKLPSPSRFMEVGTGDRQPDVEMMLTADIVTGRLGVRLSGGYNLQLPGNQQRRISSFDQPIAPAGSFAGVTRNPGDVVLFSAKPFLRLATFLSIYGGVDYWKKGIDQYTYAAGQAPIDGVDVNVLALGSKSDALLVSGGISYSHSGLDKRNVLKLPMDASIRYQKIVKSTTGIVPDVNSVSIDLRFYTRLFGKPKR